MREKLIKFSFLFFILIIFNCSNTEQSELDKGKTAFDKEDYKTAVEYFKKALKENYKNSEAYLLIGRAYLEMEGTNYNSAIDYINKSLKYSPNNPEAFVFLGDAYQARYSDLINVDEWLQLLRSGLLPVSDKAIEYYQKAINLNPRYALPYYRLGATYGFRKNEYEEAIKFYKQGIKINDNYTRVYLNLGELYFLKNDLSEAIYYIKREINRDPNLLDSYFKIANCYIKGGNYSEAIDYLNILANKDPNYEGLNYRFGIAYQQINKDKSIEYMKIAARLGDTNAKDWLKKQNINW
jgi:protein O-GlcNAc transferase